jgi:hypothetical protein
MALLLFLHHRRNRMTTVHRSEQIRLNQFVPAPEIDLDIAPILPAESMMVKLSSSDGGDFYGKKI